METGTKPLRHVHHGRNIKRLREMLGVRQEILAAELDMSQQNLSLLEQKAEIEDKLLERVADFLHVSVEVIKNMNDEATINYINSFYDNSNNNQSHQGQLENYYYTINPIDKIEELYEEKMKLYERMLKTEQEKIALLEKTLEVLKGKK